MKEKMLEFLLKRMGGKIDELTHLANEGDASVDFIESVSGDISVYFEALKDIVKEVILP